MLHTDSGQCPGLGFRFGFRFGFDYLGLGLHQVQSSNGLGFSKQVTALTLLSCPVFGNGQRVCHETQWQGKWQDEEGGELNRQKNTAMLFKN